MADDIISKDDQVSEKRASGSKVKPSQPKSVRREVGPESEVRGGHEAPRDIASAGEELAVSEQVDVARGFPRQALEGGESGNTPNSDDREERIRICAYYLWQAAGEPDGRELEFWVEACSRTGGDNG